MDSKRPDVRVDEGSDEDGVVTKRDRSDEPEDGWLRTAVARLVRAVRR